MNLSDYRQQMDRIDRDLTALFVERMQLSADIAAYKKENGLPVTDAAREAEKLAAVQARVPAVFSDYVNNLYRLLFELSKDYQQSLIDGEVK